MNISEEQTIMTTMATTTTTMATKNIIIAETTIIKYQKTIQLVMYPMMIMMAMMGTSLTTIKRIIAPKMRNTKMIMLMNLKVMVKIRMTSNKLKKILVQEEEETDRVCVKPYPVLIMENNLTGLIGIK